MADLLAQAIMKQMQSQPNPWAVANQGIQQAPQMGADAYRSDASPIVDALRGFLGGYTGSRAQAQQKANQAQMIEQARALDAQAKEQALQDYTNRQQATADINYAQQQRLGPLETQQQIAQAQAMLPLETQKAAAQAQAQLPAQKELAQARGQIQLENQRALKRAELRMKSPKIMNEEVDKLRKEYQGTPEFKKFSEISQNYRSMQKSLKLDTLAGDLDFVFGLAKTLDPTSVVREGEQVTMRKTQGLPNQVYGYFNALQGGQRLTPQARQDMLAIADNRYQAARDLLGERTGTYRDIASRRQLATDELGIPSALSKKQEAQTEQVKSSTPTIKASDYGSFNEFLAAKKEAQRNAN